ncbi:glycosyltransferase [Anabaena cylindrica FACHB-243]|uniref:Glycosyl transferase family 2 n=1 Tax=Anabaena cylindrica (strain ATCC 27899 / PCC 7122) TaxID=272123 RepID=K9ZJU8_ANACC|nr:MULTISPECIES: glycosyltransferase [Anabaena]AFZ58605.1 glycosyl transferase family 2 [Anabaena cylindrica PCC 7122]MBD2419951.1 glycosyltransferase [Anabaena cylindrica FACHB-243]MBY5280640.1 glycosyltransferase [Anabaena sp. CCAP 1446/1C]MBY5311257.1 glycosyltransferase [Anabaena sp. CCAP 1446/1C]MCM2407156.1 glycosyltransferase [Anabaena sp. CCAP 1446/1C]
MKNSLAITTPDVTIIVSPRERFSCTCEALESIYEHTHYPFQLIYIDGGSPRHIRDYLAEQSQQKQFQLIRTNYYLSPNSARNLGLRQVSSKYVVFIDNDVVVTPGWLKPLVECAEETDATIVSPLICQGTPLHTEVHCAGGESGIKVETKDETTRKRMIEKIYKQGRKIADIQTQLQRQKTGLAEFHCMMVRTQIFQQIGLLDEALLNTKEHVDLCILVAEAGGTVYLEPESLMTYVTNKPLEPTDIHYYMLRWSDAWELASLKRLRDKWNLTEDEYFQNKYKRLGWRRQMAIINPLVRKLPINKFGWRLVGKTLLYIDKIANRYITSRYAQTHL